MTESITNQTIEQELDLDSAPQEQHTKPTVTKRGLLWAALGAAGAAVLVLVGSQAVESEDGALKAQERIEQLVKERDCARTEIGALSVAASLNAQLTDAFVSDQPRRARIQILDGAITGALPSDTVSYPILLDSPRRGPAARSFDPNCFFYGSVDTVPAAPQIVVRRFDPNANAFSSYDPSKTGNIGDATVQTSTAAYRTNRHFQAPRLIVDIPHIDRQQPDGELGGIRVGEQQ